MTTSCPDEETLLQLLGASDATIPAELEQHLKRCRQCHKLVAAVAGTGASGPLVPHALTPGTQIGRFVVTQELGRGGMGIVYEATDQTLDRQIALKVLRVSGALFADMRMRLLREGRSLARVVHDNVVTIYEVGEHEGDLYLAMELVAGRRLDRWLQQGPTTREILRVFAQAGRGLRAVHNTGLSHRDFKPSNVLVSASGTVKVIDFGLAIDIAEWPIATTDGTNDTASDARVTASGAFVGTPAYAAPERVNGEKATVASDVYSYAATLFEALYGRLPHQNDRTTTVEPRNPIVRGPINTSEPKVPHPARLRRLVVQGLQSTAKLRPQTVTPYVEALERVLAARKRAIASTLMLGAVAAVAAITVTWPSQRRQTCTHTSDDDVWSHSQQASLQRAILGGDAAPSPANQAAWKRIRTDIDNYAHRLALARTANCQAAADGIQPTKVTALRTACLDRRRDQLTGVVSLLAKSGDTLHARALDTIVGMADIDECANMQHLEQSTTSTGHRDVERAIDHAEALHRAGNLMLAGTVGLDAIDQATATKSNALVARAHAIHAQVLRTQGDYARAVDAQTKALAGATKAGNENLLALTLAQAAVVAIGEQPRAATDIYANQASGLVERARLTSAVESRVGVLLAAYWVQTARHEKAQISIQASLARLAQLPQNADLSLTKAGLLEWDATLHMRKFDLDRARQQLEQAHSILTDRLGANHPRAATIANELLQLYERAGWSSITANNYREQALAAFDHLYGEDNAISLGLRARSQPDAARRVTLERAAVAAAQERFGPASKQVAHAAGRLAETLAAMKNWDSAVTYYQLAVESLEQRQARYELVRVSSDLAATLVEANRATEAVPHTARAITLCEEVCTKDGPLRSTVVAHWIAVLNAVVASPAHVKQLYASLNKKPGAVPPEFQLEVQLFNAGVDFEAAIESKDEARMAETKRRLESLFRTYKQQASYDPEFADVVKGFLRENK